METSRGDGKFKVNFNTPTPHALVDLLPQVRAEDLNQRDFEGRNLPVHEDARQVELDLEADVDLCGASRSRNDLKIAREATHFHHSWRRVALKAPQHFKTPRAHVRAVDRRAPPERKPAVGDLI